MDELFVNLTVPAGRPTSALIDEACGLTGNGLMVGEGPTNDVRALGFPQAPHPLSFSMRKEQTTRNDQLNETVH